ncbi:hypothetical protein [Clostridium perfringens]|uniref:hypothetical protein n=1 Tax=Clostridium perfringens TaxID=1502 RepID=UPI00294193BE|nr:hypothetical protein [Clostridium perfringens]MDV5113537.1 hypothetical protein [Clostridium perfringens]
MLEIIKWGIKIIPIFTTVFIVNKIFKIKEDNSDLNSDKFQINFSIKNNVSSITIMILYLILIIAFRNFLPKFFLLKIILLFIYQIFFFIELNSKSFKIKEEKGFVENLRTIMKPARCGVFGTIIGFQIISGIMPNWNEFIFQDNKNLLLEFFIFMTYYIYFVKSLLEIYKRARKIKLKKYVKPKNNYWFATKIANITNTIIINLTVIKRLIKERGGILIWFSDWIMLIVINILINK